jgi:hypothetical protein
MSTELTAGSLYEVLAEIPDPRHPRGTVYPLASVLTLVAVAMLCGGRSLTAIAQWGRDGSHLAPLLGFSRRTKDDTGYGTPCPSELHTLLAALPAAAFEAALTREILARGVTDLGQRVAAPDGKTLRGPQGHQLPGVHLLAAYCHDVEAVIAQLAVPGKTNEHKAALELLKLIPLKRTLATGDAAFTQGISARRWSRARGLLPDGQGQPSDAGGGHPGRVRPAFPPGRRGGGPPRPPGRPLHRAAADRPPRAQPAVVAQPVGLPGEPGPAPGGSLPIRTEP